MERANDLLVKRGDLRTRHFAASPLPELREGQALLRVDCFALTANNVSYAATGEQLRYWDFFPSGEEGWGRVPCWGHGDVVASRAPGLEAGARVFGCFPIGTHLVVAPVSVRDGAFTDGTPHRQSLAPVYSRYVRAQGNADAEAMAMLVRLFFTTTSWTIDDFLAAAGYFGASRVVLSSASSKTAIGLAWCLKRRRGIEAIGLTSTANAGFVEGLGCYHQVLTYDAVAALNADAPVVYVDFSGSAALRRTLHEHFREHLVHDCAVGATDWSAVGQRDVSLPGAAPRFFFAPKHIDKRAEEMGREAFEAKVGADFAAFEADARRWLRVVRASGPDAVDAYWMQAVEGRLRPREGVILRL